MPSLHPQAEGIGEETGPEMLFSLSKLKGKAGASLAADEDAAAPDFDDAADLATSSDEAEAGAGGEDDEDMGSDEEQRRWVQRMVGGALCGVQPATNLLAGWMEGWEQGLASHVWLAVRHSLAFASFELPPPRD